GGPVDVTVDSVAADSLGARRAAQTAFELATGPNALSVLVTDQAIADARQALWDHRRGGGEPPGARAPPPPGPGASPPPPPRRRGRRGRSSCAGRTPTPPTWWHDYSAIEPQGHGAALDFRSEVCHEGRRRLRTSW